MTKQAFDHQGRKILLGNELGRGGEGAVFEIAGSKDYVAKIYHKLTPPEKSEKLNLMVSLGATHFKSFAAWPVATLHDKPSGSTIGLVMPRLSGLKEIHELYSPAHRKIEFPKADWRFLIRVARNCAVAFQAFHSKGIVLGDVNQGNVLVSPQATIAVIDCDSFQISGNGKTHKCHVGVAHFKPPELPNFRELRTPNHDNFGLAVLIFHLLFMGRHPYSGRYSGTGDMSLERAIETHRFAFGKDANRLQMAPPPNCITLTESGSEIASLFESAFRIPQSGHLRPSAGQWGKSLSNLEQSIQKCSRDPGHYHSKEASCPWCRIYRESRVNFFVNISIASLQRSNVAFDLNKIWSEINSIRTPGERFRPVNRDAINRLVPRPVPDSIDPMKVPRRLAGWIAIAGSVLLIPGLLYPVAGIFAAVLVVVFGIWWAILCFKTPKNTEIRARTASLNAHKAELDKIHRHFEYVKSSRRDAFENAKNKLISAKDRYGRLNSDRAAELHRFQSHARETQLQDYLERCFIANGNIKGIGAARVDMLTSYGIETAADITVQRVLGVPGFGPSLATSLVAWRLSREASFRFDPTAAVPPATIRNLEMKYVQLKLDLQALLESGASELEKLSKTAASELVSIDERLVLCEINVTQAELDLMVTRT